MARGSTRAPNRVFLDWGFRFWHSDSEPGKLPNERFDSDGFEMGRSNHIAISFHDGIRSSSVIEISKCSTSSNHVETPLDSLIDEIDVDQLPDNGAVTLCLTPSAGIRSSGPAGPHLTHRSTSYSKWFDVQLRPVCFQIRLLKSGLIFDPEPGKRIFIQDPAPEPIPGVPARPAPAPHASVILVEKDDRQVLMVDWRFDWLSRHTGNVGKKGKPDIKPVSRPFELARTDLGIREIVLHITGGVMIGKAFHKFIAAKRKAGIHYVVDIDGHVVKMLEESHGTNHAGHEIPEKPQIVFRPRFGEDKGRATVSVNKTSIGIEHAAANGNEFGDQQKEASLDLVSQLVQHFAIDPWNVVGHNDVIVGKEERAFLKLTKPCPGSAFPWKTYQDKGLSLAPLADVSVPSDVYGSIFEIAEFMDDKLTDGMHKEMQRAAIAELQLDLRRIGWWTPGWKKKSPRASRTAGSLNLGVYDTATRAAVKLFQARFIKGRGMLLAKGGFGRVDHTTAAVIKKVVGNPDLPPLNVPVP